MENQKFIRISEAIASAILERERVHPVFLVRNADNSFIATFTEEVDDVLREKLANVDPTILVFEPHDCGLLSMYFGFINHPTH